MCLAAKYSAFDLCFDQELFNLCRERAASCEFWALAKRHIGGFAWESRRCRCGGARRNYRLFVGMIKGELLNYGHICM